MLWQAASSHAMLINSSRKRRRKLCWLCCPSALLSLLALVNTGGVRGEEQLQQQAIETVQVSRYATHGETTPPSLNASSSVFSHGRYGHAAVYQQYLNRILFIGGQIGTSGTYITNDVLSLDLSKPYTRFSSISGFTESTNPALVPELSTNLPPNAWSAYAVDAQERIWIIGGVTQDCESDAVAYVLQDASTWIPVDLGQYRPPRRRQASAIAINNGTEDSSLFVFGGIAEPYTCSLETVGYLAMDIWNTTTTTPATPLVDSIAWKASSTSNTPLHLDRSSGSTSYQPALSDYAAVSMPSEKAILYIGGQDASGKLAPMDEVLIFNTSTAVWSREAVTGEVPPSSMGHSATLLEDARIVIFGGVGSDGNPSSKLRILSRTSEGQWHWVSPDVSTSELASPSRAWHTATMAENGIIVYAFGLDGTTGETADDIYFLKTSDSTSGWQWFRINPLAVDVSASNTVSGDLGTPVYTPNSHVLVNAAAGDSHSVPAPSDATVGPSMAQNAMAAAQTPLALTRPERPHDTTIDDGVYETETDYSTTISSSSSTLRKTQVPSQTPESPASSEPPSSAEAAPATTTKGSVIAGTVTAAFVAALLAGAAALYVRRRASSQSGEKSGIDADQSDPGAPPVSQLLYTRAAPKRMLSLGSAFSIHTMRNMHELHSDGMGFERVTGREARDAVDVDEFGRMSPTSDSATVRGPTAHAMTHASSADSAESQASVASYPFLTSVPRNTELSSQNSHEGGHIDLGMNMLRSRSMETVQSGRLLTSQEQFSGWPVAAAASSSSVDLIGETSEDRRVSRPSVDVTDRSAPNPFDDFHAVLPDTPSYDASLRQRDLSFLPPSLRAGAQ